MENGIPEEGNIKIAPVPSVVDLCITTLQRYGTKTFSDVIASTLDLLDSGNESWHPNLAKTLRRMVEEEQITPGSREEKLQAACDRFYGRNPERSDIAEELEAFYIEKGGFLRRADLAAHITHIEEPVTVDYRGYTIYKCGPWTQGPYLLQTLRLLEDYDFTSIEHLSSDYVHVAIEAIKLAMADRDAYYGDPNFVNVPLDVLLSDEYTQIRRPLIDMKKASLEVRPGDPIRDAADQGRRSLPAWCGRNDHMCGRRPLGQCHRSYTECQCFWRKSRRWQCWGYFWKSLTQSQHDARPSQLHRTWKTPPHYPHTNPGTQRWQTDFSHQRCRW